MLTKAQIKKLSPIVANYKNGNRKDAAAAICKITKIDLASLMVCDHQLEVGFICDSSGRYDFHQFILRALTGWSE